MPPVDHDRMLHVANGTATTRLLDAAGIAGARSIWADPLYEGPVPGGVSDAELLEVRRRFLAAADDGGSGAWGGGDPSLDPVNDLREWRVAIERHESYDELILWYEHDLFDQLNLLQLLTWIRAHVPAGKTVSLVCVNSFPGHPHFKGLGELAPRELASLLDIRQRVDESQHELAARAWRAFRDSTPEALDALRHGDTRALPFLAAAVARFLQEYPWITDGLSRTERRLLQLASNGGTTLIEAFPRMHDGETAYYIPDGSFAAMAEHLSRVSPALLTLDLTRAGTGPLRGAVSVTDAGRAVLAGRMDRVSACGIDRWLGGVHLRGDSSVWRWDDTRQCVTRA